MLCPNNFVFHYSKILGSMYVTFSLITVSLTHPVFISFFNIHVLHRYNITDHTHQRVIFFFRFKLIFSRQKMLFNLI